MKPSRKLSFLLVPALGLWTAGLAPSSSAAEPADAASDERTALGKRLFSESRFAAPKGDFVTSCHNCHLFDEDPQGLRAHNDFLSRSWIAWRDQDPRRDHLRNSPTLLDVASMPVLHSDGEFHSLESLVQGTLTGRTFGWLPGEEEEARRQILRVLRHDPGRGDGADGGPSYPEQFLKAYGVDVKKVGHDEALLWVTRALVDHLGTLRSRRNSPYDRFIALNGLAQGPGERETPRDYARRVLAQLAQLETAEPSEDAPGLKHPPGFGPDALLGFKIFLRTQAPAQSQAAVGNCVACHPPPSFTDYSFHNIGVSQAEYDEVHGAGSFANLEVPGDSAVTRPVARFQQQPLAHRPGSVDLGFWNFAVLDASPLRKEGETDGSFLERMVATFKTPTLRHLAYTQPYMHNGAYPSVQQALEALQEWSQLARHGGLRAAAPELAAIHLTAEDLPPLLAFLQSLNEELVPGVPPPDLVAPVVDSYVPDNYPRY